jgi:hypothetical protein
MLQKIHHRCRNEEEEQTKFQVPVSSVVRFRRTDQQTTAYFSSIFPSFLMKYIYKVHQRNDDVSTFCTPLVLLQETWYIKLVTSSKQFVSSRTQTRTSKILTFGCARYFFRKRWNTAWVSNLRTATYSVRPTTIFIYN